MKNARMACGNTAKWAGVVWNTPEGFTEEDPSLRWVCTAGAWERAGEIGRGETFWGAGNQEETSEQEQENASLAVCVWLWVFSVLQYLLIDPKWTYYISKLRQLEETTESSCPEYYWYFHN